MEPPARNLLEATGCNQTPEKRHAEPPPTTAKRIAVLPISAPAPLRVITRDTPRRRSHLHTMRKPPTVTGRTRSAMPSPESQAFTPARAARDSLRRARNLDRRNRNESPRKRATRNGSGLMYITACNSCNTAPRHGRDSQGDDQHRHREHGRRI